jgi:hypothetical protein
MAFAAQKDMQKDNVHVHIIFGVSVCAWIFSFACIYRCIHASSIDCKKHVFFPFRQGLHACGLEHVHA